MTTLCLCDLVESNAERVRRALGSLQAPATAAPAHPMTATAQLLPAPHSGMHDCRTARESARFPDPAI